ncbi:hypothetical protein D3C81_1420340 [compost metagenome]
MGKLHIDALGLLTDDVDLLHARHVQQPLTQLLCISRKSAERFPLRFECEQSEGDIRVFVVDHRTDHACGQVRRFVIHLLARLVELLLHLRRGRAVLQCQRGEGQPWPRVGFAAVIPAKLLQALFQLLGDLVLHFRRRGARPGRHDGHDFDGERGILCAAKLEERDDAGNGYQKDQKDRDSALAHRKRRQIEPTH